MRRVLLPLKTGQALVVERSAMNSRRTVSERLVVRVKPVVVIEPCGSCRMTMAAFGMGLILAFSRA